MEQRKSLKRLHYKKKKRIVLFMVAWHKLLSMKMAPGPNWSNVLHNNTNGRVGY